MDADALLEIATKFRLAIEQVPVTQRPISMQNFPSGGCGDASLLLGAYLADLGHSNFQYVCGERGQVSDNSWSTHAWLEGGGFVVDITADQFNDSPSAIIVSEASSWHEGFERDEPKLSDFRLWSGPGANMLRPMYSRIQKQLKMG